MKTLSRRSILWSLITTCGGLSVLRPVHAEDRCCAHCGCSGQRCRKVCRLVQEDKKITTTCWGMQCEDIVVPGPSTPDCRQSEVVCPKGPGDKDICAQQKRLVWMSWIPGCDPEIVTKRKLMKKTITKTVPSFKWVVEDACPQCIAAINPVIVPKGTKLPTAPEVDGALLLVGHNNH